MTVRRATPEDFDAVAKLWREFDHEIPPPRTRARSIPRRSSPRSRRSSRTRIAFVALSDDGAPVGFALARERAPASARSPTSSSSAKIVAAASERS